MIIDHDREKLVQAVIFFASRVRKLGKTKLYKLLYFLDFQHYRDTGRSVTGLVYSAWPMGPVPVELHEELKAPKDDWQGKATFKSIQVAKGSMLSVTPESAFDPTHFTRRELRLLEALAVQYRDSDSENMVEATHLENLPWDRVWNAEGRRQEMIPYDYALRTQEYETLADFASERVELVKALNR
jgi:uncharacterized phage-associated protein